MTYLRFLWFQCRILFSRSNGRGESRLRHTLLAVVLVPVTLVRHTAWILRLRFGPTRTMPPDTPPLGVVLLSYKRPANVEWLVRSYLRCSFVGKVIVSNNHPEIDLERLAPSLADPRVELIRQPEPTKQGVRFPLALERAGDLGYFLSPDDDCFLYPHQIERLYRHLLAAPEVPHGISGEVRQPVKDMTHYPFAIGVRGEREVDHLTELYLFSREHVLTTLEIYRQLGWHEASRVGNGEDIALSFSGPGRPRIHRYGRRLRCNSAWAEGIATWSSHQNFFAERVMIHAKLRKLRPRPAAA
ncbi:MAG: glycosyltransferase family A protein [Thermoanaerobaculia bacterium]|nr:glycosyltransferase family A protein [Thermoanaerobaculia bacterium]